MSLITAPTQPFGRKNGKEFECIAWSRDWFNKGGAVMDYVAARVYTTSWKPWASASYCQYLLIRSHSTVLKYLTRTYLSQIHCSKFHIISHFAIGNPIEDVRERRLIIRTPEYAGRLTHKSVRVEADFGV